MIAILLAAIPLCWSQEQHEDRSDSSAGKVQPAHAIPPAGFDERTPRYQLCPGDMLDLHFEFTPEFNQSNIPVQPDGFASLSGVGDVHVAGLTVPELKQTLQDVYGKILSKPVITVTLRDFNKPYFIATGQVVKPGKYDLRANTTVIEAIGIAGGMNDTSKHSEVWVFHRMPDGSVQSKRVNVKQMLASGNLNEDGLIRPGDTIFVPQNTASKIKNFLAPSVGAAIMPGRP
jgi:polysaccharide export outer membrane protein